MTKKFFNIPTLAFSTFALTLCIWTLQCIHWNSMLDGDSALYSLMSLEVLRGKHFLYTIGQSHGGTPLVYIRAGLFKVFGATNFLGFFVNGVVVALAVGLWVRFIAIISDPLAGFAFGILAALGSSIFFQYSCTDYYALALLCGGVTLNTVLALEKRAPISKKDFLLIGVIQGFSLYICRFTPLYSMIAFGFYWMRTTPINRALIFPTRREFFQGRGFPGLFKKLLFVALVGNTLLFFPAFFTSDHFLGINAELTLKLSAKLALALWLTHRYRTVLLPLVVMFFGALLGFAPGIFYKITAPHAVDRITGLVRWNDLAPLLSDVARRLGSNFSRPYPMSLGIAAVGCTLVLIGIGLFSKNSRNLKIATLTTLPIIASWFLIHTYMYLPIQYFYPACFPVYLCIGLAVSSISKKWLAYPLFLVIAFVGMSDVYYNATKPNDRIESGVLETLQEWKVDKATGSFWSTYDMMWAYRGQITFSPLDDSSKFPEYKQIVENAHLVAHVYRENGGQIPNKEKNYRILKHLKLKHDYHIELLEKLY